jgi:hypothetical protein
MAFVDILALREHSKFEPRIYSSYGCVDVLHRLQDSYSYIELVIKCHYNDL